MQIPNSEINFTLLTLCDPEGQLFLDENENQLTMNSQILSEQVNDITITMMCVLPAESAEQIQIYQDSTIEEKTQTLHVKPTIDTTVKNLWFIRFVLPENESVSFYETFIHGHDWNPGTPFEKETKRRAKTVGIKAFKD